MRYVAYVVTNTGDDQPIMGAIRVICPSVWGFQEGAKGSESANACLRLGNVSPIWILPVGNHTNDLVIPDPGDIVLIEKIEGADIWVWEGFCLKAVENSNPFVKNPETGKFDLPMPSVDRNGELELGEYKTRVIGTKSGSALVFYDTWVEEKDTTKTRASKVNLVVGGKSNLYTDRNGIEILVDATEDKEQILITVQNVDGDKKQTVIIDNEKDKGYIKIIDKEDQYILVDTENGAIEVADKNDNVITMNEDGVKIVSGKELNIETEDKVNITTKGDIKVDAGSKSVEVKAKAVTLDTTATVTIKNATNKIELSETSIKLTGASGSLECM